MSREEILDRIAQSLVPRLRQDFISNRRKNTSSEKTSPAGLKEVQRSGTTIIAFKFNEGIFFAADRRTLAGYGIVSQSTIKIHQVAPYTAFGFAGLVSDGQDLLEYVEIMNSGFLRNFKIPLTIRAQAENIASVCRDFYRYGIPYENEFVIGGFNFYGNFELFEIGFGGALHELNRSYIGSGSPSAIIKVDDEKERINKSELNLTEAVLLSFRALHTAGEYDAGTSPAPMALPTMATVTKSGFEFVDKDIIEYTRKLVIKGDQS